MSILAALSLLAAAQLFPVGALSVAGFLVAALTAKRWHFSTWGHGWRCTTAGPLFLWPLSTHFCALPVFSLQILDFTGV